MKKKVISTLICPCTKEECPLYDKSSSGRDWCSDDGDPSTYERCPIPKKAKRAVNRSDNL
jgi:hypothetical protein